MANGNLVRQNAQLNFEETSSSGSSFDEADMEAGVTSDTDTSLQSGNLRTSPARIFEERNSTGDDTRLFWQSLHIDLKVETIHPPVRTRHVADKWRQKFMIVHGGKNTYSTNI